MEKYSNSNYKSDWKPLIREDDPAAAQTGTSLLGNTEAFKKPAEAAALSGQSDVVEKLSEINAEIEILRRGLLAQSQRIDDLFGLLGKQESPGKKRVLWISQK